MNRIIYWIKHFISPFKWKFSSQLFITIFLLFASFIGVQVIINNYLFSDYYTTQQLNRFYSKLEIYISDLDTITDEDYYEAMYEFSNENNAFSLILNDNFDLLRSTKTSYSIDVVDTSTYKNYTILLPDTSYNFEVGENIVGEIKIHDIDQGYYLPMYLESSTNIIYDSECSSCTSITGIITNIYLPTNINHVYSNNQIVLNEIFTIKSISDDLEDYSYKTGYYYESKTIYSRNIIFINSLDNGYYAVNILPLQGTEEILQILTSYNIYMYLAVLLVVIITSTLISRLIAKPITDIDDVAKNISNLNFNTNISKPFNKETESLSSSIKQMAHNLEKNIQDLNLKNQEIMALYDEQVTQLELRKRLVSSISHELKTPLMIMQVSIQGILDNIFTPEESMIELENVVNEINNVDEMLQDLFEIYKLDSIDLKINMQELNLEKITLDIVNDFENIINSNQLSCDVTSVKAPIIKGDKALIDRVITNFLTNAIKYTPNNNRIEIKIEKIKKDYKFSIINYGINISEKDIPHLFEPFYKVDKSGSRTTKTRGTGLGLYLVKEILESHNYEYGIRNIVNGVEAYFITKKTS